MMLKRLRPRITFANVASCLALFVALGSGAYAATQLPKNSVGPKQIKKNAVTTAKVKKEAITGAKVKKGTLTGTQINIATLGTVPNAAHSGTADTANAISPPEPWHLIGAPGEPGFQNNWKNVGGPNETAAFYKDHEGIVHLRGFVEPGTATNIFALPPGYRPASGKILHFSVFCEGGVFCPSPKEGTFVRVFGAGEVSAPNTKVSLNGVDFRAES